MGQNHLLLLHRFKAGGPRVSRGGANRSIGRGSKQVHPLLSLTARFHHPRFHQSLQHGTCGRFSFLQQHGGPRPINAALRLHRIHQQHLFESDRLCQRVALNDESRHREIGRSARQHHLHAAAAAARVVGRWSTVAQLTLENRIDATTGTLHESDAFERVGQYRVSRTWTGDQEVVDVHRIGETAGTCHLDFFAAPEHMHGALGRVVAMHERVVNRFAISGAAVVGNGRSHRADHDLLFFVTRVEPAGEFVRHFDKRPAQKVVHIHTRTAHGLERDFVRRQQASQRILSAQQQQPSHADAIDRVTAIAQAERFDQ